MMGTESRLGPEGADIGANMGKILGTDLGFISFIPQMLMQVSGLMGKVMDVEFILCSYISTRLLPLSGFADIYWMIMQVSLGLMVILLISGQRNGDTYARVYFADKIHGFSIYCFANGHWYGGVWHEGEARQAAEKANDVARIDEKVNRAVAAANNAINAARVAVFKAVQKQMHHSNNKDSIPLATL
ncbi:hypothetical protein WN943_015973 [Citrus x changshan-huyou]